MSEPVAIVLVGVVGTVLGALVSQFAAMLRAPAQVRLDEANAEKSQHEAAALVNKELRDEIDRLSSKITALEARVVESEKRATSAETRIADAESRANESRRVVIVLGEKLDKERAENESTLEKLTILIERLLTCIETPEKSSEIDMPGVKAMIRNMKRGWLS
jgi:chromosome segregation ATPase